VDRMTRCRDMAVRNFPRCEVGRRSSIYTLLYSSSLRARSKRVQFFWSTVYVDVVVVFGCADIAQVPNAVVRRHGNTVVVKCNYSGQTYLLTCSNNRWKGDLANCSKGASYFFFLNFSAAVQTHVHSECYTLFS